MHKDFFSESVLSTIQSTINEASGNEVFFVGSFSKRYLIEDVRVVARGNDYSVPAVIESAKPGDVVIHNHPSGTLTPSDQDIQIASVFGNQGVGFLIVNNSASQVYVVVEPFFEREIEPLDIELTKKALLPDGRVSEVMGDKYELRDEQIRMLESVTSSFNDNLISLIEAGTGTGKTLSYLIPAVNWALKNGERVVISTNTINLQEQLIDKDIPLLYSAFEDDFSYSLVKGMRNYLCLLRAETIQEGLFEMVDDDEVDSINSILDWAKVTDDGSLSDLNFTPPDSVWDKVSAESDSCLRARCPHYSRCFFYKSRREIAASQLLVVNHHLLFSDLAIKGASESSDAGILPPFKRVILDEAHHLNDTATSHFGMRATKFGIIRVLRRLKRKSKGGQGKGLIYFTASLATKLVKMYRKGIINDLLRKVEDLLSTKVDTVEQYVGDSFDALYTFCLPIVQEKDGGKEEINLRITEDITEREGWGKIDKKFSLLRIRLKELHEEIKAITDILIDYEVESDIAKLIVEFKGVENKLDYYSDVISTFLSTEEDGFVRWVEGRMGRGGILSGLGLSPLDISSTLKERLYSKCDTVVMTSATMAVNKSFGFLKSGLGLEDEQRVQELILPSPFNYEEQLLLTIPDDIPEPGNVGYSDAISDLITKAVKASNGNALILFTSYTLLETVYKNIYGELEDDGILTLKQGAFPRGKLLDKFRIEDNSVLFATDSFWEGVDVPGDALKLVVITRLPFRVPTEPIIEARVEYMENQGLNSFTDYSVPVAVLKFKQGFGRLIRTKTDKGAVLVLDKRLISKFYGKFFLNSLPDCTRLIDSSQNIIRNLKYFFG
ncbi:MAG: DEAD/DEAH box helicase family protein [Candidatus Dadabacteria bacterium]|nr:DEAD/DEAH box helicase family protein [Candidatus Dadabacteria bacterium]